MESYQEVGPFGQPAAWHCHQKHGRRTLGPPTTHCQIPMSQKSPDPRGFFRKQTKSAVESTPSLTCQHLSILGGRTSGK